MIHDDTIYYLCGHCGNLLEVVENGGVCPLCCGQPMEPLIPGSREGAQEKHLPVAKVLGGRVEVRAGAAEHPMGEEHHIGWISLRTRRGMQRKHLRPGEPPAAVFLLEEDEAVAAYAWCNLHGLWRTGLE